MHLPCRRHIDLYRAAIVPAPPGVPEPSAGQIIGGYELEGRAKMPAIPVANDVVSLGRSGAAAIHRAHETDCCRPAMACRNGTLNLFVKIDIATIPIPSAAHPRQTLGRGRADIHAAIMARI